MNLKYILFLFLVCFHAKANSETLNSIVKIYATENEYDYENPWNAPSQIYGFGTGFFITQNKILTAAHVVKNQVYIEVQLNGDFHKYPAKLVALDSFADLALLEVPDEIFCKKVKSLEFEKLPALGSLVQVLGYPIGGEELCVTQGIISRTEVGYSLNQHSFLRTQIDAPINPGNSGGPVIFNGKVIGVAFKNMPYQQNVSYMIPTPIIEHFLNDIEMGNTSLFPTLNINVQNMENPALRNYFNMDEHQSGVLVTYVDNNSSAAGELQKGDIILSIDNTPLGNDGKINYGSNRVSLSHLFNIKSFKETVEIDVLRDGSIHTLSIEMTDLPNSSKLVPYIPENVKPVYYIYGGLVFQPLTENYLHLWGEDWKTFAVTNFFPYYDFGKERLKDYQLVILSKVLPDQVNIGYQTFQNFIIDKVNDIPIKNFRELISILEEAQNEFLEIITLDGMTIILNSEECKEANARISENYHILHLSQN